jgi:hypothetical protein
LSPEQVEQFKKQLEQQAQGFQEEFNDKNFNFDQKQLDQLKQQMQQFQQSFRPEAFKFDQKQFDQLAEHIQHLQQFKSPDFNQRMRAQMRVQMIRLKIV